MSFVKPAWISSLALKVLLAYVAGVALSILIMSAIVFVLATFRSDLLLNKDLGENTRKLADSVQFDSNGIPAFVADHKDNHLWIHQNLKQHEAAYRVLDASGNPVFVSPAIEGYWSPAGAWQPHKKSFTFERDGVMLQSFVEPIEHNGRTWYLQFAASISLMKFVYQEFTYPFMVVGVILFSLVLLFVFGICALFTLRYTLRPLRELLKSAASISPRALDARLQTDSLPSEISPLVNGFNHALDRLQHGYRIQQEFLATAAHELKTPLALIRAQVELRAAGKERDTLLNDVEHMVRQVQQLLLLAEASEVQNYNYAQVNVHDAAREVITYLQRMAAAANVRVTLHVDDTQAQWLADRGALFTLLKNLLENAIQHAPQYSEVEVEASRQRLSVRDSGPGVSPEQLSRLFIRFWRGTHRRDHGAGLGLSICKEIALAHGWTLSVHDASPGLMFTVNVES